MVPSDPYHGTGPTSTQVKHRRSTALTTHVASGMERTLRRARHRLALKVDMTLVNSSAAEECLRSTAVSMSG
jgi:hypothetical protein